MLAVKDDDGRRRRAAALADELRRAGVRVRARRPVADLSFGRRATDWELKGVPVRIEMGPATWRR